MDFGRRAHIAMAIEASGPGAILNDDQTLISDFFPVLNQGAAGLPALSITERAQRKTAAWFWCLLQDFVSLKTVPVVWGVGVSASHPFVGTSGQGADRHLASTCPQAWAFLTSCESGSVACCLCLCAMAPVRAAPDLRARVVPFRVRLCLPQRLCMRGDTIMVCVHLHLPRFPMWEFGGSGRLLGVCWCPRFAAL